MKNFFIGLFVGIIVTFIIIIQTLQINKIEKIENNYIITITIFNNNFDYCYKK